MTPENEQAGYWTMLFLEALLAYRAGRKGPATEYLQFVEKQRGRPVALAAHGRLIACAKSDAFKKSNETLIDLRRIYRDPS